MSARDLRHVRWLVSHLIRDDQGQLVIAPHAVAQVEQRVQAGLDDPATANELLEQVLRLAQGALHERGEVALAKALVSMVLAHPVGKAALEASADKSWSKFVKKPAPRAPVHDGPVPEGTVPIGTFLSKRRKIY